MEETQMMVKQKEQKRQRRGRRLNILTATVMVAVSCPREIAGFSRVSPLDLRRQQTRTRHSPHRTSCGATTVGNHNTATNTKHQHNFDDDDDNRYQEQQQQRKPQQPLSVISSPSRRIVLSSIMATAAATATLLSTTASAQSTIVTTETKQPTAAMNNVLSPQSNPENLQQQQDSEASSSASSSTTTVATAATSAVTAAAAAATSSIVPTTTATTTTTTTAAIESWSGFIAGGTLTATKTVVKYPLDTITVRLQTSPPSFSNDTATITTTNIWDNPFAGIASPLIWNIPSGAIFFAVKDTVQSQYLAMTMTTAAASSTTAHDVNLLIATCVSCFLGNLLAWAVRNPSEVWKTQQQANTRIAPAAAATATTATGMMMTTTTTMHNNSKTSNAFNLLSSLPSLYSGYWENICMACTGDVVKFMLYDHMVGGSSCTIALQDAVWAGGMATAVAQYVVTPLDVVRNRIMAGAVIADGASHNQNDNDKKETSSSSGIQLLMEIFQQEGLSGLFVGVIPNVAKSTIAGGIQFASYEWTKQTILHLFITSS